MVEAADPVDFSPRGTISRGKKGGGGAQSMFFPTKHASVAVGPAVQLTVHTTRPKRNKQNYIRHVHTYRAPSSGHGSSGGNRINADADADRWRNTGKAANRRFPVSSLEKPPPPPPRQSPHVYMIARLHTRIVISTAWAITREHGKRGCRTAGLTSRDSDWLWTRHNIGRLGYRACLAGETALTGNHSAARCADSVKSGDREGSARD